MNFGNVDRVREDDFFMSVPSAVKGIEDVNGRAYKGVMNWIFLQDNTIVYGTIGIFGVRVNIREEGDVNGREVHEVINNIGNGYGYNTNH